MYQSDSEQAMPGPLDGVRVLDLTSVVMGPYATQVLGDMGADVVTVEDRQGDTNRSMGPGPVPGMSGVSLNLMRNKRSVGLDLKHPDGRAAFLRMAAVSDVVVTNLRPGPLGRLRLTYDDVRAVAPDVVFCQAHGYPSDGAQADAPAYDDIIQSASAVGDLFARQGHEPALLPTLVADKAAGLTIVSAVVAALYHRVATGRGQHVEVPMIDVMRAFVLVEHGAGAIPEPPLDVPGYRRILTAERRPQRTVDGWINILPYTDGHYRSLFGAGGRDDLLDDPRIASREARIANSDSLYRDVAAIITQRPTAEWLVFCGEQGIPATQAATLADLVADLPLVEHPVAGPYRRIAPPVRFSAAPASVRRPAPTTGQHGREVLTEVGYDEVEIDALQHAGVLFGAEPAHPEHVRRPPQASAGPFGPRALDGGDHRRGRAGSLPVTGADVSFDFGGRTVVVTGGTGGIGRAIAEAFRSAGADVVITGTRPQEDYADDFAGLRHVRFDLATPGDAATLAGHVERCDVLVNNAGVMHRDPSELEPAGFEATVEANLNGTFRACHALRPHMSAGASVVNIASVTAVFGSPRVVAYSATKGAIVQLTRSLALAWAADGIRVNAVAPGWIETDLTAGHVADRARSRQILDRTPLGRWGVPDDVAGPVLFLASDAARFVTGATLTVDDGYSVG